MRCPRLTYANVVATLTAFLVLCGGVAYAANQLAKNSVGKKQLKAKSVTAKKIRKNAVTTAKIRNGAVTGGKVKAGTLANADLEAASIPFGRVVHRTGGTGGTTVLSNSMIGSIPLANGSYTQEAGSDDTYAGAVDIRFSAACEPPRVVQFFLMLDTPDPLAMSDDAVVAVGTVLDISGEGPDSRRMALAPIGGGVRFQPPAATPHTLQLYGAGICGSGEVTASNPVVEVLGVK